MGVSVAFTGLFSPRPVVHYRAMVAATAARLLDAFLAQGPVDLVPSFARGTTLEWYRARAAVPAH